MSTWEIIAIKVLAASGIGLLAVAVIGHILITFFGGDKNER